MKTNRAPIETSSVRIDELFNFVSACSRVRGYNGLLVELEEFTPRLVEFDRFSILLCDVNRQIRRIMVMDGHGLHEVSGDEIPLSEMDVILQVLISGAKLESATNICIPMESAGRVIGVLSVASKNETCTDTEKGFLHFLADYLGGMFGRLAYGVVPVSSADDLNSEANARDESIAGTHSVSLRLSYLAQHDALTDLPNRLLLDDRLSRALALSKRYERRLAVLFLDLDRFKEVNDSLGHAIGDHLLRQVSDRLVKCVRSSDTVSRIGGDEFVVLLAELEHAEDAAVSAAKVIDAVRAPIVVGDQEVRISVSIGISIYPDDGGEAETLIHKADAAMYKAKAVGAGEYSFYAEI